MGQVPEGQAGPAAQQQSQKQTKPQETKTNVQPQSPKPEVKQQQPTPEFPQEQTDSEDKPEEISEEEVGENEDVLEVSDDIAEEVITEDNSIPSVCFPLNTFYIFLSYKHSKLWNRLLLNLRHIGNKR